MPDKLLKFFPLVKVDIPNRIIYGLVTAEIKDKDGETCHYETTKPEYKAVNDELGKASDGANIMPLREMHQLNAVGAGKSIEFDDSRKQIKMAFKVVDDNAWKKVLEKVLLGFSQGGSYVKKWTEEGVHYYTAKPSEVSLVDNPCLPGAFIEYAKADGSVELFTALEKGIKYLVPGTTHLPYTDASGKPDHQHMGAAWAALHGGYRGNKYSGPGREAAIARLKEVYHSEGIPTPSEKAAALADELGKSEEEIWKLLTETVRQTETTGADSMTPEQIKKCAAALGISEADFIKTYVDGDALEKGKKGLAALHAHLKKAMAHHEKMMTHHGKLADMHKAHGEMHGEMHDHLENCMKAHGACMDGEEADKVLKALGVSTAAAIPTTNTELAALIKAAVEASTKVMADQVAALQKKLDETPADKARVGPVAVPRFSDEERDAMHKRQMNDEIVQPLAV